VIFVLSSISMIVLCTEALEASMEEGTCMEENRSLSRSMVGWEKEPGRLRCCLYILLSLPSVRKIVASRDSGVGHHWGWGGD